ncbi:HEAT repeat domain-containing protein [Verrucomicrobia bacterium]|nr:HEAT repeat domain-containing protein [Verrucomicrobiota bacterium]
MKTVKKPFSNHAWSVLATWIRGFLLLSVIPTVLGQSNEVVSPPYEPLIERGLQMDLWAREPLLINPVALSFDEQGRLYVVETARRGTVDIDIRAHKEWVKEDLGSVSIPRQIELFRKWMAPEKSRENRSWLQDRNEDGSHDWRDLTMVKERVHLIEDTDADGVADQSRVFAEGFNKENNGAAAGVMPFADHVYYTVYPDIWRLEDTDGDGVSDRNTSLFRGFGVHAAYDGHDIHGLTVGPDGKIYFSVGDNGTSVMTREGKRLHYPNTGGVLRMNPDGSDLEFFATGLRNVQEIAFDDFGNLFSVDNDGDVRGERERFVYITEGSDSGWRLNWQFRTKGWSPYTGMPIYSPWIEEKMWIPHHRGQPAHITPPLSNYSVGPGGFKYNPGTALNAAYRGFFFLAQFPVKKITAFRVKPKGAYFEMVDEHVFHQGLMASALNFGPDGAAYIADWDGMWQPNDKGAIYKVDDPEVAGSSMRKEVKRWLAESFDSKSESLLKKLLGHADQRVRLKAQFELVKRGSQDILIHIAENNADSKLARIHALWALGQMKERVPATVISRLPFFDEASEIRAQSAKMAGELKASSQVQTLIELLQDESSRVKFMAGIALGKIGDPSAFKAVTRMLEENDGLDPYLRHAGVMAWVGMNASVELNRLKDHSHLDVRLAAVVALRRLKDASVAGFLKDEHPFVRREAARAIHDDFSIPSALPDLAVLLTDLTASSQSDEAIVRRAISANMRLGQSVHAQRLMRFAESDAAPDSMKLEALESLATWNASPFIDRVVGRVRIPEGRSSDAAKYVLKKGFQPVVHRAEGALRSDLLKLAARHGIEVDHSILAEWVVSDGMDPGTRVRALARLTDSNDPGLLEIIGAVISSEHIDLRIQAMRSWALVNQSQFTDYFNMNSSEWSVPEKQIALDLLGGMYTERSADILRDLMVDLQQGALDSRLELDLLTAAVKHGDAQLKSQAKTYRETWSEAYPPGLLQGGHYDRGRVIFEQHVAGQCVRCHDAGGADKQVGPELKGIGQIRDRAYLLESLVNPSAALAEGYGLTMIGLKEGGAQAGRVVGETSTDLTFIKVTGETVRYDKSDVMTRTVVKASSMPPMLGILTPFELRDLVEFLVAWE